MNKESRHPIHKHCVHCFWYEFENVYKDNHGKCLNPFKCRREKEKNND